MCSIYSSLSLHYRGSPFLTISYPHLELLLRESPYLLTHLALLSASSQIRTGLTIIHFAIEDRPRSRPDRAYPTTRLVWS